MDSLCTTCPWPLGPRWHGIDGNKKQTESTAFREARWHMTCLSRDVRELISACLPAQHPSTSYSLPLRTGADVRIISTRRAASHDFPLRSILPSARQDFMPLHRASLIQPYWAAGEFGKMSCHVVARLWSKSTCVREHMTCRHVRKNFGDTVPRRVPLNLTVRSDNARRRNLVACIRAHPENPGPISSIDTRMIESNKLAPGCTNFSCQVFHEPLANECAGTTCA